MTSFLSSKIETRKTKEKALLHRLYEIECVELASFHPLLLVQHFTCETLDDGTPSGPDQLHFSPSRVADPGFLSPTIKHQSALSCFSSDFLS